MRKALLAVASLLVLAAVAAPASARFGMPEPLTERGQTIEEIYTQIAVVGLIVFVLVFVLLVVVLVRYREGSGKGRATHEKHRGSLAAEMVWTLIPLAIMLWIGFIAYQGLVKLDLEHQDTEPEMAVTVTGFQWAWEMDYGGGVKVLVNPSADAETGVVSYTDEFHLPADTPILMNVTGADVIHAFNIMDANRAYVTMDDANPLGPHKVHSQIHSFPEGRYLIQCKEMCMNPGHGYMRAELLVEPRADFDRWLEERTLGAGAELVQKVHVTADADSLDMEGGRNMTIVAGTRIILEVENTGAAPVDIGLSTQPLGTVPAGETRLFAFDTAADVPGDRTIVGSNGGQVVFRAIQAEVVAMDLGAFRLIPDHLDLKAGTTYLVQVKNVHNTAHNVYIGDRGDGTLVNSATIGGGASTSFVWTAEAGEFEMWCDVPGHADLGMVGTVSVA
jgi:heme/copper-type cytochrome/quinol oxidase subunit 2/plastocyanin